MKYNKDYIKPFLFATMVVILVFTKGEAIQGMKEMYRKGFYDDFIFGFCGLGSLVAGWSALLYMLFNKK